ncbi:MAG: DUF1761 domain-containing protein [Rhizobacter sp.]|nr:DUF1761 domain-containing protein [Chlorobiales bacterium]
MNKHNHLTVILLALVFQVLGALYYGPIGFGPVWLSGQGFTPEQNIASRLGAEPFIYGLIGAIGLCYFISERIHKSNATTLKEGVQTGAMFFFGAACVLAIRFKFLGVATSVLLIDLGFTALTLTLIGGVLAFVRGRSLSALKKKSEAVNLETLAAQS